MKLLTLSLCFALLATAPLFAQSKKQLKAEIEQLKSDIERLKQPKKPDLSSKHAKVSYAIGTMIASNLKQQEIDSLQLDALQAAFRDVLTEQPLQLQPEEAEQVVQNYMQELMEAQQAKAIEEAAAFLKENRKKEGVQETASGLQYKVIRKGSGKSPGPKDRVTVHYTGMLPDGTVFDSSVERGEPATFGISQVIPGWTEALQLMQEGAKWTLYIPHELAYGERGARGVIPPYSTLIFEVELLKVE